jgi:hypothetical protein
VAAEDVDRDPHVGGSIAFTGLARETGSPADGAVDRGAPRLREPLPLVVRSGGRHALQRTVENVVRYLVRLTS